MIRNMTDRPDAFTKVWSVSSLAGSFSNFCMLHAPGAVACVRELSKPDRTGKKPGRRLRCV